ncbi:segregation/condensation protein A [bacterium]|nr:segregation/condensation protein A [bacterium]MBT3795597.1 segregation/condensation protein A [bacterium]MBT4634090.1 segregation/condensation protein A [bacterium]
MKDLNSSNSNFEKVKLDIFEGPLDLLLNLIKENNLDIYELSLTQITEQYLEYVELLKEFNFDDIGDYLVIAAELARLKSRSLLPDNEDESMIDEPEIDLVEMLKEYKKYRAFSENLRERVLLGRDTFKRPTDLSLRSNTLWEVQKTDIWKLVTSVKKVLQLENYKEIPDIEIEEDSIDQDQRRISIINNFKDRKILKFNEIFNIKDGRESVIVSFIVILDMIKEGNVLVVEDEDQIQFEYKGS